MSNPPPDPSAARVEACAGDGAPRPSFPGVPGQGLAGLPWPVVERIVQVMPFAVVVTHARTAKVLAINGHAAETFGLDAQAAVGLDARSFWVHPEQRAAIVRTLLEQGCLRDQEVEFRRADGQAFWALASVTHVVLDDGDVMLNAIKDIDERTRLLQRVKASEESLRLLADNVRDVVWTMDMEGRFTYVSPSVERLRGYHPSEVVGSSFRDVLTPESAAYVERSMEERQRDGHPGAILEQTCKDGSTVWTETTTNSLCDAAGNVVGFVGVTRDIAARKEAEDALRNLNAHFALALEATDSASFEFDLAHGRLVSTSGFERLLGYPRGEFPATPDGLWEVVHPEDVTAAEEGLRRHLRQESPMCRVEFRVRTKDGRYLWTELVGQVVDRDATGRPARLVGLCHDITERRRLETERRTSEERRQQELRLESTGLLAAGVAHDFNNLLTVVVGKAELSRARASSLPGVCSNLDDIVRACQRATAQISQLLAYAGKAVLRRSMILDPVALLEGLQPQIQAARSESVRYVPLVGDPPPPRVEGDEGMLRQLLLNVLTNAFEAVGPQGLVVVEMRGVTVTGQEPPSSFARPLPAGAYLEVTVTDDGSGMDEQTLARVFDPFFTTRFIGRGLGLPAARGIVRAHQGDMDLQSTPGRGTTVTIWLPGQRQGPSD